MVVLSSLTVCGLQQVQVKVAPSSASFSGDTTWDGSSPVTLASGTQLCRQDGNKTICDTAAFLRSSDYMFETQFTFTDLDTSVLRDYGVSCWIDLTAKDDYQTRAQRNVLIQLFGTWSVQDNTATFSWSQDLYVPFGLYGNYSFAIKGPDGSIIASRDASMELYVLPVNELPDTFNDNKGQPQIPLLLLRMFVLAAWWEARFGGLEGVPIWVATCTGIVHGSTKPFDGTSCNTKDHWLKYDRDNGETQFSSAYGSTGFDIGKWLDAYRNWTANKDTHKVNCYDQAAATEFALCIGIPHTQINWEYHSVFGFINTPLVGWGPCNNPLNTYTDNPNLINLQDPQRTAFSNHAYLSWSWSSLSADQYQSYNTIMNGVTTRAAYLAAAARFEKTLNSPLLMIDACAGPSLGSTTATREQYESGIQPIDHPEDLGLSVYQSIKDSVIPSPNKSSADLKKFMTECHYLGSGISRLDGQLGWTKLLNPNQLEQFRVVRNYVAPLLTGCDRVNNVALADLHFVKQIFVDFVTSQKTWTTQPVPVRDYMTAEKTMVTEIKYSYTTADDSSGAATSGIAPESQIASLRIALNNEDKEDLQPWSGCANHLAYLTVTSLTADGIANWGPLSVPCGNRKVSINLPGLTHRRAFVWQNLAIEVYITSDDAWGGKDLKNNALMQSLAEKVVALAPPKPPTS